MTAPLEASSFDAWWVAHSNEVLASADRTVVAFMAFAAGRKSGAAGERQRIVRSIVVISGDPKPSDTHVTAYVPIDLLDSRHARNPQPEETPNG